MKLRAAFAGQVVCVAGAGGYIGSALAKALASQAPRSLVLIDTSEYGLFEIQRWMNAEYPALRCEFILGSVDDDRLLNEIFGRFRPQTVFHSAAFKHVGLLEQNPFAAITNNALATYAFVNAAARHGVSRFVLISTDKAVNPHSAMGVSKRIAERFTLSPHGPGAMGANVIRLGNVIGSTGSVIPLFLDQIERNEALSVTHADASRYFLSKDEAVAAVLAAGAVQSEGTVLLPKFEEPIRIADLARFFIGRRKLPVRFTGLRPGEKLSEDLVGGNETRAGVDGSLTIVKTQGFTRREADQAARSLANSVSRRDTGQLLEVLRELVPEYLPSALIDLCGVEA